LTESTEGAASTASGALFDRKGEWYCPTPFTRGPWDPGLLHGGAVAALFAEVMQEVGDPAYQPVRITIDLMRPVPLVPMGADARVVRQGRRLQLIEADLRLQGTAIARASMLSLRPVALDVDGLNPPPEPLPDGPDDAPETWGMDLDAESFIGGGMTVRFMAEGDLGNGAAWFHLHRDVLAGRRPSALARAAAAADVGGAVSARRTPEFPRIAFINADISLHLSRLPDGEWIRLASASTWERSGIGTVAGELADATGTFAQCNEALVLEFRDDPLPYEQ
jgi:hypothetical protein